MNLFKDKNKEKEEKKKEDVKEKHFVDYESAKNNVIIKDYKELEQKAMLDSKLKDEFEQAKEFAEIYLKYDKKLNRNRIKTLGKVALVSGILIAGVNIVAHTFNGTGLQVDLNNFANLDTLKIELSSVKNQMVALCEKDIKVDLGIKLAIGGILLMITGKVTNSLKKKKENKRVILEMIETDVLDCSNPLSSLAENINEKTK